MEPLGRWGLADLYQSADSDRAREERRRFPRHPPQDVPCLVGVWLGLQLVTVVDVSAGGLLMHCPRRLGPGEASQLEIRMVDGPVRVRAKVVRSELVQMSDGSIQYRIAVAFDRPVASLEARQLAQDDGTTFAMAAGLPLVLDAGQSLDEGIANGW